MTVKVSDTYTAQTDAGFLLKEDGDALLLEDGDKILLDVRVSQPICNPRIAHARNWISGTVLVSGTASGFFADAPDNSLTYEFWKPDAMPGVWRVDTLGDDVNYCVIGAHNCGTSNTTVTVQYWDGAAFVDAVSVAPTDDSPIFFIFNPVSSTRFQVRFEGSIAPKVGFIKFGMALEMPYHVFQGHAQIDMARQTTMRSVVSETGEFLGKTRQRVALETSYDFERLRRPWVDQYWPDFQRATEEDAVCVAWRPSSFQGVAFGHITEVPVPSFIGVQDFMAVSFTVRARGYD